MKICWLSAGVSSAVAAILDPPELLIYQDIPDQHPDSIRFVDEIAAYLKVPLQKWKTETVDFTCRKAGFLTGPEGPACSPRLKRNPRKKWERENPGPHVYLWGLDCTETERAQRLEEAAPEHYHRFPLIEKSISKETAHQMLFSLGIKRPLMYDLGFQNNNCLGCLRGGAGYWNKIKRDFPDVFESRMKLEETIGRHILKDCFLKDLPPNTGREPKEIMQECDLFCEIYRKELTP